MQLFMIAAGVIMIIFGVNHGDSSLILLGTSWVMFAMNRARIILSEHRIERLERHL